MQQLPTTTMSPFSIHVEGDQPQLEVIIPGDPDEYRVLTRLLWSFQEKPWPCGNLSIFPIVNGVVIPVPAVKLDITESGSRIPDFSNNSPFFDKGYGAKFILSGGGYKDFIVQVR